MSSTFANFYRHYYMVLSSAQTELLINVGRTQAFNIKLNTKRLRIFKVILY